jgi:hypothetical protein
VIRSSSVLALVALMALLLCGCGAFVEPAPTPAEMDDVIADLVLRGATVHRLVSGDAGCPTQDLHDNAIHMEIALDDQSATHEIYLMRWRRQSDYDVAAPAFADCVAEYQAANPERTVTQLEANPWRAYGPGWTPQVQQTLQAALEAAGGS